ncbi:MAG: class I tRNA ligase family protein, partial [Opitutales bacterium]|nr:class I tRNA ligase family protein [Opitutales bacterium]
LKKYQQWLIDYINEHPNFVYPKFRTKQVLEFLKEPINDLCISRPKERLSWGIELPFDRDYVTYVWFDALLNYISGTLINNRQKYWPADLHVIGKDILVPAHGIYWPIMLHALGFPLPHTLLTHGWWLCSGEKMSKSLGNVVNPMDYAHEYGTDAFRYYLIREMSVGQDCDFNHERFVIRYTTDLGNDLGNLLSRTVNMIQRYCNGIVPAISDMNDPLIEQWRDTKDKALANYSDFTFNNALEHIFAFISAVNKYIEQHSPWTLAKSTDLADKSKLQTILGITAESLRLSAFLLSPVLPNSSKMILDALGCDCVVSWDNLEFGNSLNGNSVGNNVILFPRKEKK